jgi:cytochrome c
MELNKIVAGICSTFLVFLLLGYGAEKIYEPGHHSEELAFSVEVEDDSGEEEVAEEKDFSAIFAAADAASGEGVFKKCAACHKLEEGANGVGPYLAGVVGRDVGSVSGFKYSGALPAGKAWTGPELYAFLESPKKYAPGTSMGFAGLKKSEDRADLIAYLNGGDAASIPLE